MSDPSKDTGKGKLPGNHGQFGAGDATEAFKPLEDHPSPEAKPAPQDKPSLKDLGSQGPKQTNAGERS